MKTRKNPFSKNRSDFFDSSLSSSFSVEVSSTQPKYNASVVSQCLISQIGDTYKFHSDIHLILHDKSYANKIGPDALRNYLDSLSNTGSSESPFKDLSDSELLSLVRDRRYNNLTEQYEFQNYVASDYKNILDRVNALKDRRAKLDSERNKLIDMFRSKSDSKSTNVIDND